MKRAWCGLLIFACGLCAQSTAKLESDLAALADPNTPVASITARVDSDILALVEMDTQPSPLAVLDFAGALTKALAGKSSTPAKLQAASTAILDVLQSSGTPSYRFHGAVDKFRDSLIELGATAVDAKSAANRLLILGQEVRGPDDIRSNLR